MGSMYHIIDTFLSENKITENENTICTVPEQAYQKLCGINLKDIYIIDPKNIKLSPDTIDILWMNGCRSLLLPELLDKYRHFFILELQ